ncbi:MAG: hypothetical protein CMP59_02260 [Flavobacteriales bacterium]|nr:hypothetical protein [Flavobacteriales bacterium]
MEVVLEILKYVLPAAIVFVGVYFVMQNFLESELRKVELRYRSDNRELITPMRLQAYERMVLYLERINLSNLVMRTYAQGQSAKDLQSKMLDAIRGEYEHNMAQQVYISSNTWKMIKQAKEETKKVINSCMDQLNDDASGLELSQFILELISKTERTYSEVAIEALKNDLNRIF